MIVELKNPDSFTTFFSQEIAPYVQETTKNCTSAVIALEGDLGAGKSTLTRNLASFLGISEKLPSPTFLLMKEYRIQPPYCGKSRLLHVDAYRIEGSDELESLGFKEALRDEGLLSVIEWADRVKDIIPSHAVWYRMRAEGEGFRVIQRAEKE